LTGKQKIQNPGFINSYEHSTEKIINFIEDKMKNPAASCRVSEI
jgi:hypothetical protein